jgi:hypothetical protein
MRKISTAIALVIATLAVTAARSEPAPAKAEDWKPAIIEEPPAKFDHAYSGKVIVFLDGPFHESVADLWGYIDLLKDPDGGKVPACVMHLTPVGATIGNKKMDDFAAGIQYIHERGHCNGWRHGRKEKGKPHITLPTAKLVATTARSAEYDTAKIEMPPDKFDHAYVGGMQTIFDGPFEHRSGSTDVQKLGSEKVYRSEMEPAWSYSYYDRKPAKRQPLCVMHLSPVGSIINEQKLDDMSAYVLFLHERAHCNGWGDEDEEPGASKWKSK